jgi:IclR family transcriptional regulator, acetate operon repressor
VDVIEAPVEPPAYPITSVDNALRLLKLISGRDGVKLSEISELLEVAPSTAHRLLAMLRYHGFVRQDPQTKVYRAGRALLEMAFARTDDVDVRALARPELQQLSRRLDETVHLVMLDGASALYLDSVESRRAVRVSSRAGVVMPAHCTAGGSVLLAELSNDELVERVGPGPLSAMTPRSITSLAALRRRLRAVREAGYATNFGESEHGLSAVAVAVPRAAGSAKLSISVSTPSDRLDPESAPALAAAAREAADRVGESLADPAER